MAEEDITEIKVFGNDDESLKTLGQLLSNETSRKIIQLLTHKEMYTNQISKKLGIQMNITIFHLKKLVELGLLIVTHKQIVKKGVDHKYYKMVPNMFVTSTQPKKELHENGFLKKFFKDGIKFTSIILATIISFFIYDELDIEAVLGYPSDVKDLSLEIPFLVIIFGLIILLILKKNRKN